MRALRLRDGSRIPTLGMGTWYLGEGYRSLPEEEHALMTGIDAGIKLIDTAEMYGDGKAEIFIGKVLEQRDRKELYLVSKGYPHNAGKERIFKACDATLERLGTDRLDLYLLHWRGSIPLQETVNCMQELVKRGKISHWGVSNFDVEDLQELLKCRGGDFCVVDQVLYHLGSRGVDFSLAPFLIRNEMVLMAYCPLAQGGRLREALLEHPAVCGVAERNQITPVQVLLGYVLRQPNTVAIPRSGSCAHISQNAAMDEHLLSDEDIHILEAAFPAPKMRLPLDME
jgi:diketogulonate reductase-like aldo/keto reductase